MLFWSIFGFRGGRVVVSQRSVLDTGGFEIQIQIQRFEWVWRWGVVWLCAGSKAVEAALVAACSLISPQLWKLPFNRHPTALVHPARQDQETDTDSKTNNPTTINTNKIHKTMETPFQSAQLVHNKTPSHLRASQRHTDKRYTLHRQTNGNIH